MNFGQRITFRLRPKRDKDLIIALSEVESGEVSRLVREGLRMILGDVRQEKAKKEGPPKKLEWNFPK